MQLVESFSSACGFGMSLHPGTFKPRMTAESPSKVSHEVCNWQELLSRPSHTCAWVVGCERPPAAKSFPGPRGGTKIEVSHEGFNWPKKVLSGESPSSMRSSGGLLYHALSPFVPTEFSLLAGLIDGAVWAKHTIEGNWYSLTARADGSCRSSACPKVLRYVPPPQRR